jgi:hypothetical protein
VILSKIGMSLLIILLIFTVTVNDYCLGKLSAESVIPDLKSSKTQESEALTYYPYGHKDRSLGVASELTREIEDIAQTCAVRVTTIPEMLAVCDRFFESYTVLVISFYTKNEPAISRIVSPFSLHIPSEDLATKNDSEIGHASKNIHRGEDMTKQLVTLWSACADKEASKCTDIAGKFVTSINSLLIDRAEDIKEIMTEENQVGQSITRGVSLHF